jgi:hypothetical protein
MFTRIEPRCTVSKTQKVPVATPPSPKMSEQTKPSNVTAISKFSEAARPVISTARTLITCPTESKTML